MDMLDTLDDKVAAEAVRRLVRHLRGRHDAENIDLMGLAGFCRNCLSNWMVDAAKAEGVDLSKEAAREHVYGMPFDQWKALHQKDASTDQQQKFSAEMTKPKSH